MVHKETLKKNLPQILIISGIIILAIILRIGFFAQKDLFFLVDQARDMLLTKSIVVDHRLTLIGGRTGFGGLFHGPLWIYMLIPTFFLSGGNVFYTLIPMFILVSLATVICGMYTGIKLYDFKTGMILGILLAISQTLLGAVPFTTNAQVLPLVVVLYIYSIFSYLRGDNKFLIISAFIIGLGFQFESAFAFLLIPLTILIFVFKKSVPPMKFLFLSIFSFLIPISSFILFDIRHNFLMSKAFISLFTVHIKPLPGFERYSSLDFRIIDRIQALINSIYTPLPNGQLLIKVIFSIFFVLGILKIMYEIAKKSTLEETDKEFLFLLVSPIIIFGIYILYPLPLWPHYILPVSIFFIFLASLILRSFLKNSLGKFAVALFIILLLVDPLTSIKSLYSNSNSITSDGSLKNQLEVANWIVSDAKNETYGYFEYSPGILTYNMDYLMWWENKSKGKTTPMSVKLPTTYLILYPAKSGDNGAYDFWKKNVIHTNGKIVETKKFSSGIVVQKLNIKDGEANVDPNYYQNLIFR